MSTVKTVKGNGKKAVKPTAAKVKEQAKKTTVKQLSEYEKRMAIIKQKQEQEAAERAAKKAEEQAKKKRPGVIASILNFISSSDKPVNQSQILAHLKTEFPNREEKSMLNTIKAQIGGKKRPLRMEREKRVIFNIVENKAGVKTYAIDFVEPNEQTEVSK